mmetsp:Transcript_3707/g.8548  ORF Transcript_3707/g.8548 Transcript_3707/m.8548 type:complete len:484 (+) Transcript_3707:206-1657(+)|eukprot:CAMPEP_0113610366 /NCGR_PEP_ID=MMETSP0017_2-20120614/4994_1 /TAXON_ID=2856 /ORGANISM="Cylindrotheca closterium" /LENGTH=483 /DNA_ID=CAMNT_0000519261 /DNA_START=152 /DNA_END=1603 /DNA_ORIENTATION=- /assembly_acc=CAM_ASM_000147
MAELTPPEDGDPPSQLTTRQRYDIVFLVLSFSCVVSALTLVVGTGAVVVKSVGGDVTLAPFALGAFFLGMSIVSATFSPWVFKNYGRHIGFWSGICIANVGVLLSCIGLFYSWTVLVLVANIFMGAGSGIGMYLRFAAMEVVPLNYQSKAMTWTLCGGCIASFAGPEAAHSTVGMFGDEPNMQHFGVFVVAACFHFAQALFVYMVHFPSPIEEEIKRNRIQSEMDKRQLEGEQDVERVPGPHATEELRIASAPSELRLILKSPEFILPVCLSILTWAIMAMPMSIFRLAMGEVGFSPRASLTVIEFHFLSMYAPGFFSGTFIKTQGVIKAAGLSLAMFLGATVVNVFFTNDNKNEIVGWYVGLMLIGIGWNFGFSSASMWVTKSYRAAPELKAKVQAANEGLVFFFSGLLIFSTGYIYSLGGSGIVGWHTLNFVIFGLIGAFIVVVTAAIVMTRDEKTAVHDSELGTPTTVTSQPQRHEVRQA